MGTVTAPTRYMVGMLTDLALTACPAAELASTHGVLLHSASGEFEMDVTGDDGEVPLIEAVPTELLVGTSTTSSIIAQAHIPVDDMWHRAAWVTLEDVKAVIATFKPLINKLGKEITHRVQLELAADLLTVREDPSQVPDGIALAFTVGDGATFPTKLIEALDGPAYEVVTDDNGDVVLPETGHGWTADYLGVLGKVGGRRQMPVAVYRTHHLRSVVATIGGSYRCAIGPCRLDAAAGQQTEPLVTVYVPPQSRRLTATTAQAG
jgi:hypothetical protein